MIENIENKMHADVVRGILNELIDTVNGNPDKTYRLHYVEKHDATEPANNMLCIRAKQSIADGTQFYLYRKRKILYGNRANGIGTHYYRGNGFVLIRGKVTGTDTVIPVMFTARPFNTSPGDDLYATYWNLRLGTDFEIKHNDLPDTHASFGDNVIKFILKNLSTGYANANIFRNKFGFFGIHSKKRFSLEELQAQQYKGGHIEQTFAICDNLEFRNPSFFKVRISISKKPVKPYRLYAQVGSLYLSFTAEYA